MKLLDKIVRAIIFIVAAVYMLLAIKDNDWAQGTFWLLTIAIVEFLPPIAKNDGK